MPIAYHFSDFTGGAVFGASHLFLSEMEKVKGKKTSEIERLLEYR